MSQRNFKIAMTGDRALDRKLKAIAADDGPKSINKEMRASTREAIKTIVMPQVRASVPHETGFLESQLTVKAIARSRSKLGTALGFKNDLFKGDTFYAGFLEYGFVHWSGTLVFGDSFLRHPLYRNETSIRSYVIGRLRRWVKARRAK